MNDIKKNIDSYYTDNFSIPLLPFFDATSGIHTFLWKNLKYRYAISMKTSMLRHL